MFIYRLCKSQYSRELDGKGGLKSPGRWHFKGIEIIYCAESRALAMAEVAVHLSIAALPPSYRMLQIKVPESVDIQEIENNMLPDNWNGFPHLPSTRKIGNSFVHQNQCCVLKVPSAVVPGEHNFLVNPNHKDIRRLKITSSDDFPLDKRLFK